MFANRLAHGLTRLRISHAFLRARRAMPTELGRNIDPSNLEPARGHEKAFAFFAANQAELCVAFIAGIDQLAAIMPL